MATSLVNFCCGNSFVAFAVTSAWCRSFYLDKKVFFFFCMCTRPNIQGCHWVTGVCIHITLCVELHRLSVFLCCVSLGVGACQLPHVYMGHSPLSSYQEVSSLAAPAPNFPLALLLISTQSHTWDVTAVDGPDQRASTLCCVLCVSVCWGERSHTWAISEC